MPTMKRSRILFYLRHPLIRPAFGTHNLRTLAHIEAVAESLGLPPEAWEYQMIFGMAEPFQHAVTQYGRRLRLYTPVGDLLPGMAYLVRRLLENTSNESFLRKEYVESHPLSTLLAPPVRERLIPNLPSRLSKPVGRSFEMNHSGILRKPTAEWRCRRPWRPCGRNWVGSGLRRPEGCA